jgi:DNA-binding LacI/PurR family transcriptional regulator
VVGFDDLPLATLVNSPLTTVHQPLIEMAVTATELALALGRGEQPRKSG